MLLTDNAKESLTRQLTKSYLRKESHAQVLANIIQNSTL